MTKSKPRNERPRIAAVITEYRRYSHAQHILDRFLYGYGWGTRHHCPPMDLVSLYVDQQPESDLSRARAEEFPLMRIYPTIEAALTEGGDKLAVDGILLIAEHGQYPQNERGQRLYPRYEFFREIVEVFEGRRGCAPVFVDKHLSWNWDWAVEMVETSRQMGFGLMAGSSIPVTSRLPPVDLPLGADIEEAMCVGVGSPDSYDFHMLEGLQAMVERRKGGETGVVSIHAIRGEAFWDAMRAGSWEDGGWDPELFRACLCRSLRLGQARENFNHYLPTIDELPSLVENPIAYRYQYGDGLKACIMLVGGIVGDMTFAARLRDEDKPFSTLFYGHPREICNFFSPLVNHMETLIATGQSPYPVERTLLTTGLTAAGVESFHRGQQRVETPHLDIRYEAAEESTFWQGPMQDSLATSIPLATEPEKPPHKRIAVIGTIWTFNSHVHHITDRFEVGYPLNGEWHKPNMEVVSLWLDQHPEGDLSEVRARQFDFGIYPTIAEALRCGGDELAVDAVLMIAEHGDYPSNSKDQKLYPRYEWFQKICEVFEQDGRSVPVYNDKHLSYDFDKARKMVADSERLGFPMVAGSSLPFTWRLPELELPLNCEIEEVVMSAGGDPDAHCFHALEGMQAMIERRRGGEAGVKAVQLLRGDDVWRALEAGRWSNRLLEAAFARSDEMQGISLEDARTQDLLGSGVLPDIVEDPWAWIIERNDGLQTTLLLMNGAAGDFLFAAKLKGQEGVVSTQMLRSPGPNVHYSACLASNIQKMFETGRPPYPVERTLLVSGILDRAFDSLAGGSVRLETPELDVRYTVGPEPRHAHA
jgi:hypothetical protein